ncbi:hypothetical protein [Phytoactinopolyspora mesophila]|nr:hypothetical protein [Phytoactinopolyspora mesophila]
MPLTSGGLGQKTPTRTYVRVLDTLDNPEIIVTSSSTREGV